MSSLNKSNPTKAHILSRGPPTTCHHCGQILTIDHMLLECAVLRVSCDEYYTADSLNTLFETIPETCIVKFLREAGFFYLIWTVRHSIQSLFWTIPKLKQFFKFMYTTSDMSGHISSTTLDLNELATDKFLNLITPPDLFVEDKQIWEPYMWRTTNISWTMCVVVKQIQSIQTCAVWVWTGFVAISFDGNKSRDTVRTLCWWYQEVPVCIFLVGRFQTVDERQYNCVRM